MLSWDREKLTIWVPNGKQGYRVVTPSPGARRSLEELKHFRTKELDSKKQKFDESKPIFCHPDGSPINSFKKSFEAFLKEYNLLVDNFGRRRSPYSLRHTYTCNMIAEGVNHWDLAKNMGTSVELIEKHYVHDNPDLWGDRLLDPFIPNIAKAKASLPNLPPRRAITTKDASKGG